MVLNWLKAILLIMALSIFGLIVSPFVSTYIPLWVLTGFGCIFSIEKWVKQATPRQKGIGKLYRLILNLSILALLGLLIWSGFQLFSHKFSNTPLLGSLVFIGELVIFIWLWRALATVVIVSRLITQGPGKPSSIPKGTSEGIWRSLVVTGATVTSQP
jgi:hypothetical protein